jgi:beta-galactosidase
MTPENTANEKWLTHFLAASTASCASTSAKNAEPAPHRKEIPPSPRRYSFANFRIPLRTAMHARVTLQTRITQLLLTAAAAASLLAATGCGATAAPSRGRARVTLPLDDGWRFSRGEVTGGSTTAVNDREWQVVRTPHDWSIAGPVREDAPSGAPGGFFPTGISWYRKHLDIPAAWSARRVFIEFDGVYANSEVWINGHSVGKRPFGYVGFRYELTDHLHAGDNLLAVRTDTTLQPDSRWYTGQGIYRHVRLVVQEPTHLVPQATVVTTPQVAPGQATVHAHTAVVSQAAAQNVWVEFSLIAPDGRTVQSLQTPPQQVEAAAVNFDADLPVPDPQLWDIHSPAMYRLLTRVHTGARLLDEESTSFGIRHFEFKPDTGFWLNGRNLKLYGVALHDDLGALGAAVPEAAWMRRLQQMKDLGANAIRTAHNPPSPEMLDACDKLGLLVMDEAFDAWTIGKERGDYHLYFKDWWREDLAAMVKRDRNHPSVIIYSVGNEIWDLLPTNPDPAPDAGLGPVRPPELAKSLYKPLQALCHELDPTRPVTQAILRPNVAGVYTNGYVEMMDVVGQNYRDSELAAAHQAHPTWKIIGTENYHEVATWRALRDNPALSGQFLWTGADYLGEAPRWPLIASQSGLVDRTGLIKPRGYQRQSWWSDAPMVYAARIERITSIPREVHYLPGAAAPATAPAPRVVDAPVGDWTPQNLDPHDERVEVYSNCDEVELFLNNRSLGSKPINADATPRQWTVPFEKGTLRAIARNKGRQVATSELRTAGQPARIVLTAERSTLTTSWEDVVYVRATVVDDAGTTVPAAENLLHFHLTGPAMLAGVDNGSTSVRTSFTSDTFPAFRGNCVAILRATGPGTIAISASADGLQSASATLHAAK